MTLLRSEDFYAVGFNTDMLSGWEAQLAMRTAKVAAVWPAHYRGVRVSDFEKGSRLARAWMSQRRGVGDMRRSERARQFREEGAVLLDGSTFCEDRRGEQLDTLRRVVEFERYVVERLAQGVDSNNLIA